MLDRLAPLRLDLDASAAPRRAGEERARADLARLLKAVPREPERKPRRKRKPAAPPPAKVDPDVRLPPVDPAQIDDSELRRLAAAVLRELLPRLRWRPRALRSYTSGPDGQFWFAAVGLPDPAAVVVPPFELSDEQLVAVEDIALGEVRLDELQRGLALSLVRPLDVPFRTEHPVTVRLQARLLLDDHRWLGADCSVSMPELRRMRGLPEPEPEPGPEPAPEDGEQAEETR